MFNWQMFSGVNEVLHSSLYVCIYFISTNNETRRNKIPDNSYAGQCKGVEGGCLVTSFKKTYQQSLSTNSYNFKLARFGVIILVGIFVAAQDERKGISQQSYGDPPQLFISLPKLKDLPGELGRIKDVQPPVDILLIAVKDIEFLSCFYYLRDPARIYDHASVGYVYTGHMGEHQEKKLKVALVKCFKGGAVPGGSLATVRNAVPILRPKAVFSVGICSGLNRNKSKLGDVVVSAKLITSSHRPPAKKYMADLLRHAGDGWQAPLQNPQKREVRVHCDGVFVSCLEVTDKLVQHCPEAIAAESEGEGVFAAGHDLNVQWAVVKGVAHYAGDSTVDNERWEHFASVMAASVLANILRNPIIFDEWPNYQAESLRPKMKEENTNWNVMIIIAVVIGFLAIVTSLVLYNGYN